jgi:hypothetical protein
MRWRSVAAVVVGTAALIACGGRSDSPKALADATTKAVYDDDVNAMQARFDDDLRKQVTIDQIATISSKLHSLGAYKGLEQTTLDTSKGRYDFDAHFDQTTIPVHLRLDPDGRIAAYRLDIPQPISER